MALWSAESGHAFGAASRLSEGAGSPSRLAILRDAWALTAANPLFGVGWGEFNFAWSLTPFPDRPIAFFDHTHNLPAQLAVELGLPWAGAVLLLLGWALFGALPGWATWVGAPIIIGSGLYIVWREHVLRRRPLATEAIVE